MVRSANQRWIAERSTTYNPLPENLSCLSPRHLGPGSHWTSVSAPDRPGHVATGLRRLSLLGFHLRQRILRLSPIWRADLAMFVLDRLMLAPVPDWLGFVR